MPKIVAPLTANGIEKAVRQAVPRSLRDGAQPGLELRVRKDGASWSIVASGPTGRRRFTLGSYPEIGLARARSLADTTRKKHMTAEVQSAHTLAALFKRYGEVEGVRLRSWGDQGRVTSRVFRAVWDMPCRDLTTGKIQQLVDAYPAKIMAARAVSYLRTALKWGRKRGYVDFIPAELETPKGAIRRRDRVLSPDELRRVIPYLLDNLDEPYCKAMWIMLLTACRREEVVGMTWEEIEPGGAPVFKVPAMRSKNKTAFVVPLTPTVMAVLGPRGTGRVFPSVHNWSRHQNKIYAATDTTGWHRHDLRRTAATVAGELGIAPHIVDTMLGHRHLGSSVHTTYNLSRYLPEHREALQTVADYYCKLTE